MNPAATVIADRIARTAARAPVFRTPVEAYAWAWVERARGARWIAAGGSSPLGVLGHVNAGLELDRSDRRARDAGAERRSSCHSARAEPRRGSRSAFAIAKRDIAVLGVRVVPRIIARAPRVRALAHATAKLIERLSGVTVPRVVAATR